MSAGNLHVIVLAGGKGTRFWPLSTPNKPKQFLSLFDDRSLLLSAVERVRPLVGNDRIWISTDGELADLARTELADLPHEHFVIEPVARNTLPGIALACAQVRAVDPAAVVAVVCADHLIRDESGFRSLLASAAALAARHDCLITFGIRPTRPETGYGYIQFSEHTDDEGSFAAYGVQRFTEKPDLSLAEAFVREGHYLWNSGMFVWRLTSFFDALGLHQPELLDAVDSIADDPARLSETYPRIVGVSIDYGLMEKATNILVIPAEIGWDDVGSWESVWNVWQRDDDGNAVSATHEGLDTRDCLIFGGKRLIATVGLDSMIIVDTDDALLICPRERAQEVRALATRILARGKGE
ncbi:mannose-1-phosphate guanyltransferase [Candidatus Poribacteria bacterium]|nr:mannose-1-phosphate guanyltransferase [Candidatus Poribacteria bacterium]